VGRRARGRAWFGQISGKSGETESNRQRNGVVGRERGYKGEDFKVYAGGYTKLEKRDEVMFLARQKDKGKGAVTGTDG